MEDSVVQRFLDYKPPQSPEEQKQIPTPQHHPHHLAGQRSQSHQQQQPHQPQQHQQHQRQPSHTYTPSSPLHHYRLPISHSSQRASGMASALSPAASARASISSTSSSAASPSQSQSQAPPPRPPRPRPHSGPKAKFTLEDDALLMELKEKHDMTWKRISEFFPGRSSGTLQVRYCTRLRVKEVEWTDELVERLRHAMQEYESEKWRIVSNKVGQGFSAAACKQKAEELRND